MLLLDAINEILPKLGEHPVTSTEDRSPTLAVVIPEINACLRRTLLVGYWFNEWDTTLYPNSSGVISLPIDTLRFVSTRDNPSAVRGSYLLNLTKNSNVWTGPVDGRVTVKVPFEELPESAAQYILYSALVVIYATDIGLEQVVQLWRELAMEAQKAMTSEHLQNKRYSARDGRHFRKIARALSGE